LDEERTCPMESVSHFWISGLSRLASCRSVAAVMSLRGILFDSLQARWGATITTLVTSLLFGIGHLHGYPPGPFGACLAALFGLALGLLRLRTGGLALPITAHIAADATVYWILFHGL